MLIRRKPSVEQLLSELRRAPEQPRGFLARWRLSRLERRIGRTDHRQVLQAYYNG